jgi:hypothetical protein
MDESTFRKCVEAFLLDQDSSGWTRNEFKHPFTGRKSIYLVQPRSDFTLDVPTPDDQALNFDHDGEPNSAMPADPHELCSSRPPHLKVILQFEIHYHTLYRAPILIVQAWTIQGQFVAPVILERSLNLPPEVLSQQVRRLFTF